MLALPNIIDTAVIHELRDGLWGLLDRSFAIRKDAPGTWYQNQDISDGTYQGYRLSGMNHVMRDLQSSGLLDPVLTTIQEQFAAIFGADRWEPLDKWYSLLTFPSSKGDWNVPHNRWHSDEPIIVGDSEPWSVFTFVFLDSVERETGPTVAVTGSHRRGEPLAERDGIFDARQIHAFANVNSGLIDDPEGAKMLTVGALLDGLAAGDDWFADLKTDGPARPRIDRLIDRGTTQGGVTSRVVEFTGEPGDVILFDPRCLHSSSPNVSADPRQVLRIDLRRLVS